MKRFKSFLAPQLEQYTTYRQTLGYVDKTLQTRLRTFDRYVKEKAVDQRSLNPLFFLALRKKLRGEAKTVNSVLSTARGFFQFLIRQGFLPENAYIPFADPLPPQRENHLHQKYQVLQGPPGTGPVFNGKGNRKLPGRTAYLTRQ